MTKKEAIDELSVLSERISDGETVNVFVHDGNYGQALEYAIKVLKDYRNCGNCIHNVPKGNMRGCEVWTCDYEERGTGNE